jgi:hypothetical protein
VAATASTHEARGRVRLNLASVHGGHLSLAQFEAYVKSGDIHCYIYSGSGTGGTPGGASTAITTWVAAHYRAQAIGGETVYDLNKAV